MSEYEYICCLCTNPVKVQGHFCGDCNSRMYVRVNGYNQLSVIVDELKCAITTERQARVDAGDMVKELEAEIERISGVGSPYGRMHHAELMQTEAVEALEEERAKNAALNGVIQDLYDMGQKLLKALHMARLWKMVAKKTKAFFESEIPFYVEEMEDAKLYSKHLEERLSNIEVCWTCNCFVSDDDDICTLNSPRPCDRNGTCHSWRIKQIADMEKGD